MFHFLVKKQLRVVGTVLAFLFSHNASIFSVPPQIIRFLSKFESTSNVFLFSLLVLWLYPRVPLMTVKYLRVLLMWSFWASQVAQMVKNLAARGRPGFDSWWEDPLEEGTASHSSVLPWRILWTEKPGRLQSMGSQRVGHDWVTLASRLGGVWDIVILFVPIISSFWVSAPAFAGVLWLHVESLKRQRCLRSQSAGSSLTPLCWTWILLSSSIAFGFLLHSHLCCQSSLFHRPFLQTVTWVYPLEKRRQRSYTLCYLYVASKTHAWLLVTDRFRIEDMLVIDYDTHLLFIQWLVG